MHNPLHNLGQTRSSQKHNHLLLTPDTFVRTALPGMKACTAIVHAGPAMGAKFTQYTAEFESGGELGATTAQRFLYILEGQLKLVVDGRQSDLGVRGYAFLPEGTRTSRCSDETKSRRRHRKTLRAAHLIRITTRNYLQRRCNLF